MKHPIELTIQEPLPGAYVWQLLETDEKGESPRLLRRAFDAADNYETALSAGQRALRSEIRQRAGQDVKLSALPVTLTGGVFMGSGVMVDRVQRQYNEFVERNLRNTVSDLASQEPMVSYANRVVDIMGGQSMGLSSALDRFFESARALSGDASST
eukprot:gene52190-69825_t